MKTKVFAAALLLMMISFFEVFAQGTPCGDSGDPDVPSTCPLDSWVLVLAAVALLYGVFMLYKKQKSAIAIT